MSHGAGATPASFRLLGPFEASIGGRAVPVTSPKHRTLLATLLLNAGRPVTVAQLTEAVWGERPPRNPRNAIQVYVTRLRNALTAPASGTRIDTCTDGYRIEVPDDGLDLARFHRLLRRADDAATSGDTDTEAGALADALALWRSGPLDDVPSEVLQREVVPRLRDLWLQTVERRVDVDLRRGRHAELTGELIGLTAAHPLRERLAALLVTALHHGGRRADALHAYHRIRIHLADDVGISPGAELQALYHSILHDLPGHNVTGTLAHPAVPRQVPAIARVFVGRVAELARLDALVRSAGTGTSGATATIVSVTGVAGIGKSALAALWGRRSAGRFPDGQIWVNLHGDNARGAVTTARATTHLLGALGVRGTHLPAHEDDRTELYRAMVHGRRMLIVLDGAADSRQARALLPATPESVVLVTSRDALSGLVARDGAIRLRLGPLDGRDSATLVRRLLSPAVADAVPDMAARIAAHCAGVPIDLRTAVDRADLGSSHPSVAVA